MINWKVRLKNLNFWLAAVPAVLLVLQSAAALAGVALPVQGVQDKLLDLINAVFGLLAILGIVNDPTTKGLGDSRRAMEYKMPN
uniref:Holin n=1 Tax=Podoviridae sp. ctgFL11 TaxID=2827744 RepID=A0A8S5SY31_9CAUD|nr:MAG TPA: holin [Podoviridae sp. ctgFL11]